MKIYNIDIEVSLIKDTFLTIILINLIIYILLKLLKNNQFKKIKMKNKIEDVYEFGSTSIGTNIGNNMNFYIIAVIFIIFDIELVVLIPWIQYIDGYIVNCVSLNIIVILTYIIIIGIIFELKNNIFNWYK